MSRTVDTIGMPFYIISIPRGIGKAFRPMFCKSSHSMFLQLRSKIFTRLKQTIHLAKNERMDQADATSLIDSHWKQLAKHEKLCAYSFNSTDPLQPGSVVSPQAMAALRQANYFLSEFSPMLERPDEFKRIVEDRSRQEPRSGICDVLLFGAIQGHSIDGAEFIICPPPREALPIVSETDSESFWQKAFCPQFIATSVTPSAPSGWSCAFANHLLLPHFIVEYQTPSHDAFIRARVYLASLVAFYSALGIDDYPFYCLVASGTVGSLLIAWKSSAHKVSPQFFDTTR